MSPIDLEDVLGEVECLVDAALAPPSEPEDDDAARLESLQDWRDELVSQARELEWRMMLAQAAPLKAPEELNPVRAKAIARAAAKRTHAKRLEGCYSRGRQPKRLVEMGRTAGAATVQPGSIAAQHVPVGSALVAMGPALETMSAADPAWKPLAAKARKPRTRRDSEALLREFLARKGK